MAGFPRLLAGFLKAKRRHWPQSHLARPTVYLEAEHPGFRAAHGNPQIEPATIIVIAALGLLADRPLRQFLNMPSRPRRRSASGSPSSIIPTVGWQSVTAASNCGIGPLTKFARSRRPRSSRTNGSVPRLLSSASSSCAANPNGAAPKPRAAAISATLVSSKLAELFYQLGELAD